MDIGLFVFTHDQRRIRGQDDEQDIAFIIHGGLNPASCNWRYLVDGKVLGHRSWLSGNVT